MNEKWCHLNCLQLPDKGVYFVTIWHTSHLVLTLASWQLTSHSQDDIFKSDVSYTSIYLEYMGNVELPAKLEKWTASNHKLNKAIVIWTKLTS